MRIPSLFTFRSLRRLLPAALLLALGGCAAAPPGDPAAGDDATAAAGASRGSPGTTGPTGVTGPDGGDDEGGGAMRARAARGLAISPVPLSLDGRTGRERRAIGLGSYIVNAASDCAGCHSGPAGFLSGGNPFFLGGGQVVWTRNLTPDPTTGLALTRDQFLEAMRTGRDFHPGSPTPFYLRIDPEYREAFIQHLLSTQVPAPAGTPDPGR